MKTVGVRALKQNASAVVADTDRGKPVAQLVPLPVGHVAALIAARQARPPKRSLADLADPAKRRRGQRPLSKVLAEQRDEERF
jgi:antitoxin (DNA-binding transcriptional repressor) of toxin-antitoxin stability system